MSESEYDRMKAQKDAIVAHDRAVIWNEAVEACRKAAAKHKEYPTDCECLGGIDPETGVAECSLEVHGGGCLCLTSIEVAEKIESEIAKVALPS